MKRFLVGFLSALLAVCMLGSAFPIYAAEETPSSLSDEILRGQMEKDGASDAQAWLDRLAETVGDGREWYVLTLAASGEELDFTVYAEALVAYLAQKAEANAVTRQKYAMVLLACGYDADFVEKTRNDSLGKLGVMSYVFGLHLANNRRAPDGMAADAIVTELLALRRADGGFSVSGEISDTDVTAMALQALSPYYGEREDVTCAVDEALLLLSEKQNESGGFSSYGVENPESTAQVIIALCSLGIEPFTDVRFIKNGNSMMDAILRFRTGTGEFSHSLGENTNATSALQVFLAMTAVENLQTGRNPIYLFENTENLIFLTAEQTPHENTDGAELTYRFWTILAIVIVSALVCILLLLCKKKNVKTFLSVGIVAVAAILVILFTDFQSADSYYNGASEKKSDPIGTVTLSIRCDVLIGKTDSEYVPKDGVILDTAIFEIEKGDTVYDVLEEAARVHRIQMETKGTDELVYVEGIAYLYELQFGDLSGWVYSVNGASASVGAGNCVLSDGDAIEWSYTLDLGRDIS